MSTESIKASDASQASATRRAGFSEDVDMHGEYFVECRDKDGHVKWFDKIGNLVTTIGKTTLLDTMFGPTAPVTWYLGLIASTDFTDGPASTDTMLSHPGWVESTIYSQSTRIAAVFAAGAAGEKQLSAAAEFSMAAGTAIMGCFLASSETKGSTTGILYSAGQFTNGERLLDAGDTLSVSYKARA